MINFVCEFARVDGTISIGEDCAGLATFSLAVESAVRSKGGTVDKVWASDNDIALRTMLERLDALELTCSSWHDDPQLILKCNLAITKATNNCP